MKCLGILRRFALDHRPGCRYLGIMEGDVDEVRRRNEIFNSERRRQLASVGRVEKIKVTYEGPRGPVQLLLNKQLSTPYNVAQHLGEWCVDRSVVALINGETAWDMHRELETECSLRLATLSSTKASPAESNAANRAFWRSCSFLMGRVIADAFKERVRPLLHSFPSPNISSGSFVYDCALSGLDEWEPSLEELRALSARMLRLAGDNLPFHRLKVSPDIALQIFSDNKFKLKQIPDIAQQSPDGMLVLYRVGGHIDISKGPMIANTGFLGRCSITAVHRVDSPDGQLYRFQGVALPKGILLNHFAYHILEERSSKLNTKRTLHEAPLVNSASA